VFVWLVSWFAVRELGLLIFRVLTTLDLFGYTGVIQ